MPPTNSTFQPNTSYQTDMVGLTGADVNYSSINGAIGFNIYDPRLRLWSSRRQRAQELKNLHESSWQLYWAWYRNATDPLTDPADWWRSNEQIPTPFKIVETLLPRYILGMFDSPDYFVVEARNGRSEIYETLIYNLIRQQTEEMMLFPNLYEALRYSTVMGHCWGKVIWREEYSTRQTMRPYDMTVKEAVEGELGGEAIQQLASLYGKEVLEQPSGIKGIEAVVIEEEDFNGPMFEWRPLDRVFPDPTGKGKWYIEEIDTTIDELLDTQATLDVYDQEVLNNLVMSMHTSARNAQGGGVDGLGDMRSGTSAGVSIEYQREPETTEGIPEWIVSPMREGRGVKLWQCWGWVPPEMRQADGSAWRLTVIAEGKYVLRDDPSPTPDGKPPYFPIKSIAIPGRLYGESILHYVGPLSDQQSRLANMRLDEVFLGVWQQYAFRKSSVVSDNAMLMQPGGAIEVNPEPGKSIQDTFMVLPRRDVLPSVWQEDGWRQQQAEHVSGATDTMQGVGGGDRTTATEVERMLQQGNARHVMQTMWNDYTVLKEILQRSWEWDRMRLTTPRLVQVYGEEYVQIDLRDLQPSVDFVVGGGIFALSRENRVQMDVELLEMLKDPMLQTWFKIHPVLRKWMQDRGWKNPEGYLKTEEERNAELYQQGMDTARGQVAQQQLAATMGQMGMGQGAQGELPASEGAQGNAPSPGMPEVQNPGNAASVVGSPLASGRSTTFSV